MSTLKAAAAYAILLVEIGAMATALYRLSPLLSRWAERWGGLLLVPIVALALFLAIVAAAGPLFLLDSARSHRERSTRRRRGSPWIRDRRPEAAVLESSPPPRTPHRTMVNQFTSLLLGGSLATGLMITSLLVLPPPYSWLVGLLTSVVFGAAGLVRVPVGYLGVVLFLGARVRFALLDEGWNWIPPFVTAVHPVDVREQRTAVSGFTGVARNGVRVTADASVQWCVVDPYRTLSVTDQVIEHAMPEVVRQAMRTAIRSLSSDDVFGTAPEAELARSVTAHINPKVREWGISVSSVVVSSVSLPGEVMQDYELSIREERQRASEVIEAAHVRQQIKEFMDALQMSSEEARRLFQIERGKIEERIQRFQLGVDPSAREAVAMAIRQFLSGSR